MCSPYYGGPECQTGARGEFDFLLGRSQFQGSIATKIINNCVVHVWLCNQGACSGSSCVRMRMRMRMRLDPC